jgi:hypothetical protein
MNKKIYALISVLILVLGYYLVLPAFIVIEANEDITFTEPTNQENNQSQLEPVLLVESNLIPQEHDVEGKILVLEQNNQKILRFEDFYTINGPNLHIYLVDSNNTDQFIDLGEIKATKGNVNYQLPDGIDLNKFNQVRVYCVPFKKVFSYAILF